MRFLSARFLSAFFAVLFACMPAVAQDTLTFDRVTTMETPQTLPTAGVFMIIDNKGADDTLIGVSTPRGTSAELHKSAVDSKGVMTMREVRSIAVPSGKATVLAPMGSHIMVLGVTEQMVAGQTFPLTLKFEKAGEKQVNVEVVKPAAMAKRFPPELMGANLDKMRAAKERAGELGEGATWTQRLREKIQSLGKDETAPAAPQSPAPVPADPAESHGGH